RVRGASRAWIVDGGGAATAEPPGSRLMRRLALALLVLACSTSGRQPRTRAVAWTPLAAPSDLVVARVRDVPIYASTLREHAQKTGLDKRGALDDLVTEELLAQEARRRGLSDAPEVREARAQALVRRFVTEEFGRSTAAPEVVPEHDAHAIYQQMYDYFHHQRLLRVRNV